MKGARCPACDRTRNYDSNSDSNETQSNRSNAAVVGPARR